MRWFLLIPFAILGGLWFRHAVLTYQHAIGLMIGLIGCAILGYTSGKLVAYLGKS